MRILKKNENTNEEIIIEAISVLNSGGLIVVPSDTVYGLSVDATNKSAVTKLINFKSRPPGKAISVFVGDMNIASYYVDIPDKTASLLQTLIPGPYTIVLQSKGNIVSDLESEKGTLGIRIPDFVFINRLIETFGRPITATSANMPGRSPHYSIESLLNSLSQEKREMIDLIVDFDKLPRNKPSTVVDVSGDELEILRKGDVGISDRSDNSEKSDISKSEDETKDIAKKLLRKHKHHVNDKPLVFMLYGDLGVGKTVFVKGIGEDLNTDNIISPTFVIYYEYDVKDEIIKHVYHFDLFKIREKNEFRYLGFEEILKPGNIVCIEWSERSGEVIKMINDKAHVINVEMEHVNNNKRKVSVR